MSWTLLSLASLTICISLGKSQSLTNLLESLNEKAPSKEYKIPIQAAATNLGTKTHEILNITYLSLQAFVLRLFQFSIILE